MGDQAGAPIEPDSQTRLLNAGQSQCAGVVGSGVPGGKQRSSNTTRSFPSVVDISDDTQAGGYDAIWTLIVSPPEDEDSAISRVEKFWNSWKEVSVRPLSAGARVKPSDVTLDGKTTREGLVVEKLEDVDGLRDRLLDGPLR
jgi:hypothetical protein